MDETIEFPELTDCVLHPIRISQILYSVWRLQKKQPVKCSIDVLPPGHAWVKWATESLDNYEALWNHGMDLLDEHAEKYGNVAKNPYKHGSVRIMEELGSLPPLPAVGLTDVPKEYV